jgi:hypothetical protein
MLACASSGLLLRAAPPQPVGTWAPMGAIAEARSNAASVSLADGRTLIAGGTAGDGSPTDSVTIYDPIANSFKTAGRLIAARVGHTATLLTDGRVLVAGGTSNTLLSADLELFDPAAGTSTLVALLTQPRTGHAAARLFDGNVLIVGGSTVDGVVLQSAELFDPASGSVTPVPSNLQRPRVGASATTLIDGRVLVTGGHDGSTYLDSAEIFDPYSQTFTIVDTRLSIARKGHTAILLPHNNSVLIAGGTSADGAVAAADLFLPAEFPDPYSYGMGRFAPTGEMAVARSGAIGGPAGDDGFAFLAGGGPADAEAYRFATVKTDKDDYPPGQTAIITGSGWEYSPDPDQGWVTLVFQEDPAVHEDYVVTVKTDSNGNIYWDQWAPEQHDLNVRFYLTAKQATPQGERRAQMTFTDSQPQTVTVSPASVQVLAGASAGYTVTVTKGGNNNSCTIALAVTGLPTGASASITGGINPFLMTTADVTRTVTINTTNTGPMSGRTPSGTYSFTVTTQRAVDCQGGAGAGPTNSGQLIVLDQTAPTTASVTVPANGATFTAATVPATFSGSAADNTNGLGLNANSTTFTLQRPDNTYWNGSAWQAGAFDLLTTHSATTSDTVATWTRGTGMPVWGSQPVGTYRVQAKVTDKASPGNTSTGTAVTFTLQSAGPTKLAFTSSAFTGAVGQCLGSINIQTQNASNLATNVTSHTTVNVATDGSGGFFSDNTCTTPTASVSIPNESNAASLFYKATARGTGSHLLTLSAASLTSASQAQTITKAEQTITFGALGNKTYGDGDFGVNATASSGLTVSFSSLTTGVCTVSGPTVHIVAAGTCTIRAAQAGDANYNAATPNVDQTFTVAKAATTTTVTCATGPFAYTGAAQTPCSAHVIGAGGLNQSVTPTYVNNMNAGPATVNASFAETANHFGSSDSGTFVIGKAPAGVTLSDLTPTYTGSPLTPTATTSPAGLTVVWTGAPQTNAGSYPVTATITDTNYEGTATGTLVIGKAPAGVTLSDLTPTYTGSPLTPTATTSPAGLTVVWTGAPQTNAGAYPVTATITDTNYEGTASGTLVIGKANATISVTGFTGAYDGAAHSATAIVAGVVGDPLAAGSAFNPGMNFTNVPGGTANWSFDGGTNYNSQSGTAAIVINKADAVVTATGYTGTYDGAAHGASGSVTGVDAGGAALGSTLHFGTSFTDAPGGTANWLFSGGMNYLDESGTAAIVINKAVATVVVTGYTGVYDGGAHGASGTVLGVDTGGAAFGTTLNLGASFTNVPGGNANWTLMGGTNYTNQNGTATIVINKANATIAVAPYTAIYDGAAHTATATAVGVGGVDLSGQLVLSGTTHTTPGDYLVDPWSFTGGVNYNNASGIVHDSITYATGACLGAPGRQILQPLNWDGTSLVKKNSTAPAKFRVCDAAGDSVGAAGVVQQFRLVQTIAGTLSTAVNEEVISTTPDTNFRWDATERQWIFNINTKNLSANQTYVYEIKLNDGTTIPFRFGLK